MNPKGIVRRKEPLRRADPTERLEPRATEALTRALLSQKRHLRGVRLRSGQKDLPSRLSCGPYQIQPPHLVPEEAVFPASKSETRKKQLPKQSYSLTSRLKTMRGGVRRDSTAVVDSIEESRYVSGRMDFHEEDPEVSKKKAFLSIGGFDRVLFVATRQMLCIVIE